jgi:ABC-type polysaccharide/polyol phosphate export permease
MLEPGLSDWTTLQVTDASAVPVEPSPDTFYRHHARLLVSLRALWANREIVYTLAERDFRAQYKQATLGVLWALLSPVLTLVILIIVFSRAKTFGTEGLPFALFAFVGILCWSFFASSLGNGGQSLLVNKALLNKTQFPRECFPLETMLLNAVNTVLSWIPLTILFVVFGRAPAVATLWTPMFMLIEVVFAAGVTLAIAGTVIQMRDLVQVLPIIISVGLFVEPVIWPFSRILHLPTVVVVLYSFLNPLGPVIDNVRRTMLLGQAPDWPIVGLAALGSFTYLVLGYKIFKRLEVQFADIA